MRDADASWASAASSAETLGDLLRFAAPRLLTHTLRLWGAGVRASPVYIYELAEDLPAAKRQATQIAALKVKTPLTTAESDVPLLNGICPGIEQTIQRADSLRMTDGSDIVAATSFLGNM
jgi:hypothetical protein